MVAIPTHYAWLEKLEPLPKMITAALGYYGIEEREGAGNNPRIVQWAKDLGIGSYNADSIPWCGLFMARVATDTGRTPPKSPLWALNWARFEEEGGQPELGDVLVFTRDGGGHVGLYVAEDDACFHVLGGNQSDRVSITRIEKHRLYAVRQPPYVLKPATAIPYFVSTRGAISTNEG